MSTTIPSPAVGTVAGRLAAAAARGASPAENATTDWRRFALLLAQLGLFLVVCRLFDLEGGNFFRLATLTTAAFAVHYWLPFAWKEPFWIAVGIGGAFVLLDPMVAAWLLLAGALFYGVLAAPLGYGVKVAMIVALAAAFAYGRATSVLWIPFQFWAVFGAIFMFRLVIYVYDLRFAKQRPPLRDFLAYFFVLPNYYFVLFPVIDFQTMRKSYYRRDGHEIVQQGLLWMARGVAQLLIYRAVYHLKPSARPEEVTSLGALLLVMVTTYLLYLRVSGQFHLVIGMLHLFGYDLPETHRKYLLASSLTDFWRRINIYWKDFMVKVIYFPVYFRWRKSGDVRAQVIATATVFVATWALHSYQWFWLRGSALLSWPDTLFWAILGSLVIVNLLIEQRRGKRQAVEGPLGRIQHSLKVAGTFSLIVVLWSLWNAPSLADWVELLTWWQIG